MVDSLPLQGKVSHLHITQLGMLNVIVALKIWAHLWENKVNQTNCNNSAVVEFLTYGRTKDEF